MFKKFFVIGVIALMLGLLAACGGETTNVEEKDVAKVEAKDKNGDAADKEKEAESDVKELNQEIVDNENIKATLVSVEKKSDETWGDSIEVTFEVENKREDTIEVQAREVSTDGKMVDESMLSMSQEISGGKKADAVLTIENLEEGGKLPPIEENLEMVLHAFSWDDMDYEENQQVKVEFK